MRLYVANATRQAQTIYYRLDFNFDGNPIEQSGVPPAQQGVASGRQIPLGGELKHISQAETIIRQLERFGAIAAKEANRQTKFAPYIYSVDTAVSAKIIQKVFDQNQVFLAREGGERREMAAIAATELIPSAQKVTIGTEQVGAMVEGVEGAGASIAEGVELDRMAPPPDPAGARGHRAPRVRPSAA